MEDTLTDLFCLVDDFCQEFIPEWERYLLAKDLRRRRRASRLSHSEIMTIYIHFHQSGYRHFKHYYLRHVREHLASYFPNLVSYPQFVALTKTILIPLCCFLKTLCGECTGFYFIDATPIKVCHIKRASKNRIFKGLAKKGRSTMGWFFGFKLHIVVNEKGELMAFKLTYGNVDDRSPVPDLVKNLSGKLIGDKGYISQALFEKLYKQGLQLLTRLRKNMKNKLMPIFDKLLLKKRGLIESINDQLKNISQIEHTRHRSIFNFMCNIIGALAAYALQPKKPSLTIRKEELELNMI